MHLLHQLLGLIAPVVTCMRLLHQLLGLIPTIVALMHLLYQLLGLIHATHATTSSAAWAHSNA